MLEAVRSFVLLTFATLVVSNVFKKTVAKCVLSIFGLYGCILGRYALGRF